MKRCMAIVNGLKKVVVTAVLIMLMCASIAYAESVNEPLDKTKLAALIANTRTARLTEQIILVVDHNLTFWHKDAVGRWNIELESYNGYGSNGMSSNRHAGDKTTPIGSFPILYAFGLVDNPGTDMEYKKITPRSYLSGESDYTYNTWVEADRAPRGSEHLIDYYQYKYAMNIGFNINPVVIGRGAAIFLHCKSHDHWSTSGCVSVPENVMLELLLKSHNGTYIIIVPSMNEIAKY